MFSQLFMHAVADRNGRLTQINEAWSELLGFRIPDILGRTIRDITHPADWPENEMLLNRMRDHGTPFTIVKRYFRADGTVVWIQGYVSILYDNAGRTCMSATIRPVLPDPPKPLHILQPGTAQVH